MVEEATQFGEAGSLIGILTLPSGGVDPSRPVVVILNSGIAHRVGTSRLYVRLAREVARRGLVAFRFDFSGNGDSDVRRDSLRFEESAVDETRQAIGYLSERLGTSRYVVTGICRGSQVSFDTAIRDNRVVGVALMNHPFEYGEQFEHEVKNRQLGRVFWTRLWKDPFNSLASLRGKASTRRVLAVLAFPFAAFLRRETGMPDVTEDVANLKSLVERDARLLLVYSEFDAGLDTFKIAIEKNIEQLGANGKITVKVVPGADHTFTLYHSQSPLLGAIGDWATAL